MALAEKHRSVIYAHLVEQIGEEAAEAMLSQFPARDLDEPVTKEFVAMTAAEIRGEISDVRTELRVEIAELRGEMRAEFAKVRGEMRTEFANVRTEMTDIGNDLAKRVQVTVGAATALATVILGTLGIFVR